MDGLRIEGRVAADAPDRLTHGDLFGAPDDARVDDVGALVPGRRGAGVRFAWLVDRVRPDEAARWVTLESSDGRFAASLERHELADAVVVHAQGDRPFGEADGGPFRLYIPGARDACGNVKHLGRVAFDVAPGADTRPPVEERDC
jgi:DMSO/TMAO reductase YedYZ molybdopterin-dependent catalytic subunit